MTKEQSHPKCPWHPRGKQKLVYVETGRELGACLHPRAHTLWITYRQQSTTFPEEVTGEGQCQFHNLGNPADADPVDPGIVPALCGAPSCRVSAEVRRPVPLPREAQHRGPAWPAAGTSAEGCSHPLGVLASLSSFPLLENCGSSLGG